VTHRLPDLPYAIDALEPHMSRETLEFHYGRHHRTYVDTLNRLVRGTDLEHASLEAIIRSSRDALFNNAAQAWNHEFFWQCLSPAGGGVPTGELARAIDRQFGSFEQFREAFSAAAVAVFGSGWAWLIRLGNGTLEIQTTPNAGTPLASGARALLTCDMWEHAYYIDHRNRRPDYLESFWRIADWGFVGRNFA
jgi:superoxide dismutase, Fe-Mn family